MKQAGSGYNMKWKSLLKDLSLIGYFKWRTVQKQPRRRAPRSIRQLRTCYTPGAVGVHQVHWSFYILPSHNRWRVEHYKWLHPANRQTVLIIWVQINFIWATTYKLSCVWWHCLPRRFWIAVLDSSPHLNLDVQFKTNPMMKSFVLGASQWVLPPSSALPCLSNRTSILHHQSRNLGSYSDGY